MTDGKVALRPLLKNGSDEMRREIAESVMTSQKSDAEMARLYGVGQLGLALCPSYRHSQRGRMMVMVIRKLIVLGLVTSLVACANTPMGAAQNRCLEYGFRGQNALAHCAEAEMSAPPARPISFGQIDAAQNACLALGYTRNALADCTQRHARGSAP